MLRGLHLAQKQALMNVLHNPSLCSTSLHVLHTSMQLASSTHQHALCASLLE